jgi:hypothetical protein
LKTDPRSWEDIDAGTKLVDLRPADRGFRPGDLLVLREYDPYQVTVDTETQVESPGKFTGRVCHRWVTHVLPGGQYGLEDGYVALSILPTGER